MKRGEIWLVAAPDSPPRPHVVLTRNDAIPHLNKVLTAPLTRTRRGIPTEVDLEPNDGVRHACVVSLDNVEPIRKVFLTHRISVLSDVKMHEVCRALARATGCP